MSRTRRGSDQAFGMITIVCQLGHVLGKVFRQPDGRYLPVKGDGWMHEDPLNRPLSMQCTKCHAIGLRPDLRGSWDKIKGLLDELEADPTRGKATYKLGG